MPFKMAINYRENETQIKAILATFYTFGMSPYVGVVCMFISWIFLLYHIFRLSGGTNVLIIQRVFGTAFSIWVQKKIEKISCDLK